MITIHELLDEQEAALRENNVSKALRLLEEMRDEIEKQNAWRWLRSHEPEDYDHLIEKLEQAKARAEDTDVQSSVTVLGQLIGIFNWCRAHGFELKSLSTRDNLHKYWAAAAYMNGIIGDDDRSDGEKLTRLKKTLKRIQQEDATREDTCQWARSRRKPQA
jgi:hypothetical protein